VFSSSTLQKQIHSKWKYVTVVNSVLAVQVSDCHKVFEL
jgi:hypothetical protein